MRTLLLEHTAETGQIFTPEALDLVWTFTAGQPWLVNALAYETTWEMRAGRDRSQPITAEMIQQAKENLILRRVTHLDQLADKLREPRVRARGRGDPGGRAGADAIPPDDITYVRDLGLIKTEGQLTIANPIYQEVIPRELTYGTQLTISRAARLVHPAPMAGWTMPNLLAAFQSFFRENSRSGSRATSTRRPARISSCRPSSSAFSTAAAAWIASMVLAGAAPTCSWSGTIPAVCSAWSIELKLLHGTLEQTLDAGLAQTWDYADRCAADEAHLVIFDRSKDKPWGEKIWRREENYRGMPISVWGT